MAIYHLSIKVTSRGKGKSVVAAAAYRAGEKIFCEYNGKSYDYTNKGGVIHAEIMLPENAPKEYTDRAVLWNSVEKSERYKTAQLAREIEVALPKELTAEQNLNLVRDYVKKNFVQVGMCADFAIHDMGKGNPHAHILLTMRPIEPSGKWGAKSRNVGGRKIPCVDWNDRSKAEVWRKNWSDSVNAVLERYNHLNRVDNRSFIRQGKQELPTVHLGVAASQIGRKGIRTERGDYNRNVLNINCELRQIKARIRKLQNWLDEEAKKPENPMLGDVIQDILSRQSQSGKSQHYQDIANVKNAANMLLFLTENNISDMADLDEKVNSMYVRQSDIRGKLKPVERRLKTLDEHIKHADNFKKYKHTKRRYDELYSEYEAIKKAGGLFAERKAQKALDFANNYYESNRTELTLFNAAEQYLKDVLQERFNPKKLPPITKWKAEYKTLSAEKDLTYREYYSLKDEVKEAEKIKRSVENLMKGQEPQRQREEPQKKHDFHL